MKIFTFIFLLLCFYGYSSFAQKQCRMMFLEEYDEPSIAQELSDGSSREISDGYYYIEGFMKKRLWLSYYPISIDEEQDFEIETSIKRISARKNKYTYGIIYGCDGKSYYSFRINTNGAFKFQKYQNGEYVKVIPLTESEFINNEEGGTNKLGLKKTGDTVNLYINDHFLASLPFESFFGNNVGFFLARKQKIAIDYLKVIYSRPPVEDEFLE